MSKTTKILVAVLIVFGAIYAIQRLTSRNSTTESSHPFAGIDTAEINRVEIDFGKRIVVQRTGGYWTITSPVESPADPGQMDLLLTRIASDPTAIVVADNLSDSSTYGLGEDAAFASFATTGGKKVAMRIGNLTPDFDGCYIQLAGKNKVLQLSTDIRTLVGQSLTSWRDKQIFHFGVSDIEAVDFSIGDTLYHFFRSDTTWKVNGINVPEMTARDIVGGLIGSTALGFIDSTISPSRVIIDYGITLTDKRHITGQIFKSAESEVSFGQLCLSNSADNQIYTVTSTLPQMLLQGLKELQTVYLSKERT